MPFQPGNTLSNSKTKVRQAQILAIKELLAECFTDEQRRAVIQTLIDDAQHESFDVRQPSRTLLLAYAYGKPTEKMQAEISGGLHIMIEYIDEQTGQRVTENVNATSATQRSSGAPIGAEAV